MTHYATAEQMKTVERLAGMGVPMEDMAILIGIAEKTLRKRYAKALETGRAKAHLEARTALFDEAVRKRNPTMLIFYCKTQLGMRDVSLPSTEAPEMLSSETREQIFQECLQRSVVSVQDQESAPRPAIAQEPIKEPA